jgi:preprotein translocase subunit SecA
MSSLVAQLNAEGIAYPERLSASLGKIEEFAQRLIAPIARRLSGYAFRSENWTAQITDAEAHYARMNDQELKQAAQDLRPVLLREGFRDSHVAKVFALVREAASRTIGQRHFNVQLLAGRVLLRGRVAEMEAGEGKTLTATLAASTAALAGIPVHIVTVNDYLAARDAEAMGSVYRALGLTVGVVLQGITPEARRAAYGCDVTYCTNKELVFDYLKDRLVVGHVQSRAHVKLARLHNTQASGELLLRGLHFAIVDEADSVLIDEARTPLIIARRANDTAEQVVYEEALMLATGLVAGRDFLLDRSVRTVRLTPHGESQVAEKAMLLGSFWQGRRRREAFVEQALTAVHLFHRDKHYLVQDAKVQIIDEYTGRIMPDRSWERGLHQMIEVKEQCSLGERQETLARISYQRFFRRYLRLAGMTGTAREVAGELWSVYGLGVVRIPTNRPLRRRGFKDRIYTTADAKWHAVVDTIARAREQGRPVLVGTRTVQASEHLSNLLADAKIPHRVLNARQDQEEAETVAKAAESGRVTVATNMAGRGTDICLAPGVAELGGLHVLATERHDAHRIDRQLFGRCGRQGDPGSYEAILSLEDELITAHVSWLWRKLLLCTGQGTRLSACSGGIGFWLAQRSAQRKHASMRRAVLKMDEQIDSALAFAGRGE